MNVPLVRYAVGLYAVLCAAVSLNLLFLQPISLRPKLRQAETQGTSVPQGTQTKETAAIEAVKEKPQLLAITSSQSEESSLTKLIEKSLSFSYPETFSQKESILALQKALESKGYLTGAKDGSLSSVTQGAILAFEFDNHLPLTGEPQAYLLQYILEDKKISKDIPQSQETIINPSAEKIIRSVQKTLMRLGYRIETEEGKLGQRTIASIRQFEVQQGMRETGRISGDLIVRLSRFTQKTSASETR